MLPNVMSFSEAAGRQAQSRVLEDVSEPLIRLGRGDHIQKVAYPEFQNMCRICEQSDRFDFDSKVMENAYTLAFLSVYERLRGKDGGAPPEMARAELEVAKSIISVDTSFRYRLDEFHSSLSYMGQVPNVLYALNIVKHVGGVDQGYSDQQICDVLGDEAAYYINVVKTNASDRVANSVWDAFYCEEDALFKGKAMDLMQSAETVNGRAQPVLL